MRLHSASCLIPVLCLASALSVAAQAAPSTGSSGPETDDAVAGYEDSEYAGLEADADSSEAYPTIHPGPETNQEARSGVTTTKTVASFASFLAGVAEFFCAIGNVMRIIH